VKFDDIAAAGTLVKAVDILGDHTVDEAFVLKRGKCEMGRVGHGAAQQAIHFEQHVPDLCRMRTKRIDVPILHGIES
jgi:hypothetical protein